MSSSKRDFNPALSKLQINAAMNQYDPVPANCVVTGGTGFVGSRLVEMLVERGAKKVISFDIVPKSKLKNLWDHPAIEWRVGDITNAEEVADAIKGADCVWHIAAAVGPFHPHHLYKQVNYQGTCNVLAACKKHNVSKLVHSSSPSTRFEGAYFFKPNYDGETEESMPSLPLKSYMQAYAETKAMAEMEVTKSVSDTFFPVSVAPHQVYGPRDNLFMPNILEAAGYGKLRVLGDGLNRICNTHVDNYAHALIIAERKLFKGSPVLGKFYIATDGKTHPNGNQYAIFWKEVATAVTEMGFTPLKEKVPVPFAVLYPIACIFSFIGWCMGKVFKLNIFTCFALTMHRWFDISAVEKDLDYQPIIGFEEGWAEAIQWFKVNWLPDFKKAKEAHAKKSFMQRIVGLSTQSQDKIDIQAQKK